jgi:membrane-bound lytic murein transglycosylase D
MANQTNTRLSFLALAALLITAVGCGYNQHSKFQMSFLPPAPKPVAGASFELAPPPPVESNIFLKADMPAVLLGNPESILRRSKSEATVGNAALSLQRGKLAYQRNDVAAARREFDAAVDMMLQAAAENPSDWMEYERRLDEVVEQIHHYDLAGLGASAQIEEGKFEKAPLEDLLQMTFPVDPRLKDRVRDQVASTVSQLPLSVNDTVLGYINYFANRGHRTIVAGTQRSGRYRPMIRRILDEEGVPQELIHLAQAESGFIPRAMSRAAAGGMWQFLKWRGNEYGLSQTAYTDDRMDPEQATRAAAHHLRDLYTQFGDWYLAIAAYNCGPGAVEKAVERTGYADFWELRRRGVLPAETTNYVPIILAMTIMEKNPAEYGIEGLTMDPPVEYDTVEISALTSMALVSDIADVSPAELAALNPAVLRGMIPGNYHVHVPKGTGNQVMTALNNIAEENRKSWRMHRVGSGETLASIGKRYSASPSSIASANRLEKVDATDGDVLLIPAAFQAQPAASKTAARPTRRAAAAKQVRSKRPVAKPAARAAAPARKPATKSQVLTARAKTR